MKKTLLIVLSVLLLPACAEKEKFEEAVIAQIHKDQELQKQQNLKDYKLDPDYLAKCVVDTTSNRMPGFFSIDPTRMTAYRNYAKMLTLSSSTDPKKTLEELRQDFGSPKALAEANSIYAESVMDCYSAVMGEADTEAEVK
jgi:hypothetical protein